MILSPTTGFIAEKYRIKKLLFLTLTLLIGMNSFLLIFLPKTPLDTIVELKCDTDMSLIVNTDNIQHINMIQKEMVYTNKNVTCQVRLKWI